MSNLDSNTAQNKEDFNYIEVGDNRVDYCL